MKKYLVTVAALFFVGMGLVFVSTNAVAVTGSTLIQPDQLKQSNLIQNVHYSRSCREIREYCSDKWGGSNNRDYAYCVRRNGCWVQQSYCPPRCRYVREHCAYKWGWGSWEFRQCVIRRGCRAW